MVQLIDKQINEYLPLLGIDEKKSILSVIKSFLKIKKEQRLAASIENYNQELETAESEYENGNYISHEEMLKQIKQW